MAINGEKAISILAGNLNLGRSYLITTVYIIFIVQFVNVGPIKGLVISKGLFGVILDQKANEIF